ncbi:MAG: orotidine-5'-phosphate decarboxylase [Hyphomicrobiaceae bacterium]
MQSASARTEIPARDRLIVALDTKSVGEADAMVKRIGDAVTFYKVGLELVLAGGLELVGRLHAEGYRLFLDMKLLDIGNTVEMAVARVAALDIDFLTIHGLDTKTVAAAVRGRAGSRLKVLGVTVLTNLDRDDLAEQGLSELPENLVVRRAKLITAAGGDGVITSAQEARSVRAAIGAEGLIVTPGIRLAEDPLGDQARVATPAFAIANGADHIVVGRPITQAADPRAAATRFQDEIAKALVLRA